MSYKRNYRYLIFLVYKKPPDQSVWNLDLKRKDEKLTAMLRSAKPVEEQQQETIDKMKKQRAIAAGKIEAYAKVSSVGFTISVVINS